MEISTEASRSNMETTAESSDKSVHYYNKKSNSYSSQAEAMSFFEEGNLSMNNGDYGTAIENYKRCLENADKDNVKMMVYFCLGNAYTLCDNWEEGLNSFNDCLKFSSKVESEYFEHQLYLGMGSVHSNMKRLEDAMKKDEMECLCHIALGGLNKLLKNYEQSLEHYRKGFSLIIESQQQQHEQHHRSRRPRKVGGINAVSILESSDLFMIGRGSPLNSEGEVECDAMIMEGHTLQTGAVISGRNFKNPVCLARKIMEQTPHCALSGDGALKFALSKGFPCCSPNELINKQKRLPPEYFMAYVDFFCDGRPFPDISPDISLEEGFNGDTAFAVAIDRNGRLACATSTGGMPGKLKGRVSDTALVGCGGYANYKGAAAATGHGEKLIQLNFTRQVVFNMESGSAQEAVQDAVNLAQETLRGRPGGIAIDSHGNIGKAFKNDLMPWVSIKNDEMKFGLERDEEGNYPFELIENNGVV
ncbi:isoaspartyl peptidase/L-asparaginase-like [Xenia sp. Carnegie-2017]|uniref:isoaspartyl peptidase/L-asparaginase-like n=1 Tax=Xenia sp. Carnegie-2017 TaxID=2897299 RepID=UPI001F049181|nr:isoaspartyl peptidase/L-asparaginase-like [Xenia sp. Carnegie-2017]